jgi:sigma-E factor negative regulatory protein RseA
MTDQINEQISRFIDDEMSVEESEFFLRRLERDDDARAQYKRYQLIGAAVRGEYLHSDAAEIGRRLGRTLDDHQISPRRRPTGWIRFASGAGIAASVALVAVLGLKTINPGPQSTDAEFAAIGDSAFAGQPSYVVPASTPDPQQFIRVPAQVTGIQFLMHHAGYTSGVSRTIMQSSMIAARESDPAVEGVPEDAAVE